MEIYQILKGIKNSVRGICIQILKTSMIIYIYHFGFIHRPLCNARLEMADVCRVTDKVDALVRRHMIS